MRRGAARIKDPLDWKGSLYRARVTRAEKRFHEETQPALHNCTAYDLPINRIKAHLLHMQHFLWL
jgi:hypothetical protein